MEDEPDERRRRGRRYGLGAIAVVALSALVAVGGRIGWSLYSYNTPAERMPPDLCALLRAETLERLVPEHASTKPATDPHSDFENSGHCTVDTKSPRTTESRALLSLYLYRFAGQGPRQAERERVRHCAAMPGRLPRPGARKAEGNTLRLKAFDHGPALRTFDKTTRFASWRDVGRYRLLH